MLTRIKELQQEIEEIVARSVEEAEEIRIKYLSKKGEISKLFEEFRNVSADQKKEIGQAVNTLKEFALEKINLLKEGLQEQKSSDEKPADRLMTVCRPSLSLPLLVRFGSGGSQARASFRRKRPKPMRPPPSKASELGSGTGAASLMKV